MSRYRFILLLALALAAGCASDPTPTVPLTPTPTPPSSIALADVSLHAGLGSDYPEVAQAPKDSAVSLLGTARGSDCTNWVLVRTVDGAEGWTVPVLVNIDISKSVLPAAPTPTAAAPPTPMPATCTDAMALVQIDNNFQKTLDVFMAGAEPGIDLTIEGGAVQLVCVAPGDYCYDLTDGDKHETGYLYFSEGECTCWHWGGGRPQAGSCQCSEDVGQYHRP